MIIPVKEGAFAEDEKCISLLIDWQSQGGVITIFINNFTDSAETGRRQNNIRLVNQNAENIL